MLYQTYYLYRKEGRGKMLKSVTCHIQYHQKEWMKSRFKSNNRGEKRKNRSKSGLNLTSISDVTGYINFAAGKVDRRDRLTCWLTICNLRNLSTASAAPPVTISSSGKVQFKTLLLILYVCSTLVVVQYTFNRWNDIYSPTTFSISILLLPPGHGARQYNVYLILCISIHVIRQKVDRKEMESLSLEKEMKNGRSIKITFISRHDRFGKWNMDMEKE